MQNNPIRFKFSLLPGDLINALAGVRHICISQKKYSEIYLGLDIQWKQSELISMGRTSPYTLTSYTMEFLKPLLLSQQYISKIDSLEDCYPDYYNDWTDMLAGIPDQMTEQEENIYRSRIERWYHNDKSGIVDLDKHHLYPIGLPYGNIFRWNFYIFPDMACDLSKPWLDIAPDDTFHDYIVVNRTLRCRNEIMNYNFLKKYKNVIFVGLDDEYRSFRDEYFNLPHLKAKDALELATFIRSAKCFVGNQSLCFSLAEAMKVPRVLEICNFLPNVIPTGEQAYDCYFPSTMEWHVKEIMK